MVLNQSTELHDDSDAPCDTPCEEIVDLTIPSPGYPQLEVNPQPVGTPPLVGSPGLQMTATHGTSDTSDTSDTASMPSQDESALIQDESALIQNESTLIQDESTLIQDESELIQDLTVAHTADMRRYMLGKSMSGMLSLLQYACQHVLLVTRRNGHDCNLGCRAKPKLQTQLHEQHCLHALA